MPDSRLRNDGDEDGHRSTTAAEKVGSSKKKSQIWGEKGESVNTGQVREGNEAERSHVGLFYTAFALGTSKNIVSRDAGRADSWNLGRISG